LIVKKSVLFVCSYPDSILNFRKELLYNFHRKGYIVNILLPKNELKPETLTLLKSTPFKIYLCYLDRCNINVLNDIKYLFKIFNIIYKLRPKYVFSYTIKPVLYSGLLSHFFPSISFHSLITGLGYTFSNRKNLIFKFISSFYRLSLCGNDHIFFQNIDDLSLFHRLDLVSFNKSSVVNGSGINLSYYNYVKLEDTFSVSFVMISRFIRQKGLIEYLKAVSIVHEIYPDVTFSLVGWYDHGPDSISSDELQYHVSNSNVDLIGRVEDPRPILKKHSVIVLPSYREGVPRSVLVALAIGRAVITTDVPGCKETVLNGENGYLIKSKSVKELSNAMIKLIENPNLVSSMGCRSRQIACEKFDVHKVNKNILNTISSF